MRTFKLGLLGLALLALANAAAAEPLAARSADPTSPLVEALVANSPDGRPAWWRVSRGDSVVDILALPAMEPHGLSFDDADVRRRLEGAQQLILSPQPGVNALGVLRLALAGDRTFSQKAPLSGMLPPELARRLHRLLAARGQRADALDDLKPAYAGWLLANSDDGKTFSVENGAIQDHIRDLARRLPDPRPRIVSTGSYDVVAQLDALNALPPPAQLACFEDGLRTAEADRGGVGAAARQWRTGRIREIVASDRGFEACLSSSPVVADQIRRGIAASTRAIAAALQTPGHSVALVELRPLLACDGVLDRLRRQGFEVRAPGS